MVRAAMQPTATLLPMSSLAAQQGAHAAVPEWVHLLPAGTIATQDPRGPYRVADAAALIAASMQAAGGKLPIDENHSTDLAAPQGGAAPARGWIVELAQREDGIWGRVEWTEAGRALVADGAYRGISPVIVHRKDGTITALLRAALTNTPNMIGLTTLHHEESNMLQKLLEALGLKSDADEATALNAITALKTTKPGELLGKLREALGLAADADETVALNAARQLKGWNALRTALMSIAEACGVAKDADATAILNAVKSLVASARTGSDNTDALTALQHACVKTIIGDTS